MSDPKALKQDAMLLAIIMALDTQKGREFMEFAFQEHMDHTFSPPTKEDADFITLRMASMLDQSIACREGKATIIYRDSGFQIG